MKNFLKKYIKNFLYKNLNELLLNKFFSPLKVQIEFNLLNIVSCLNKLVLERYIYFNVKVLNEGVNFSKKIIKKLMSFLLFNLDNILEKFYKRILLLNEEQIGRYEIWRWRFCRLNLALCGFVQTHECVLNKIRKRVDYGLDSLNTNRLMNLNQFMFSFEIFELYFILFRLYIGNAEQFEVKIEMLLLKNTVKVRKKRNLILIKSCLSLSVSEKMRNSLSVFFKEKKMRQ